MVESTYFKIKLEEYETRDNLDYLHVGHIIEFEKSITLSRIETGRERTKDSTHHVVSWCYGLQCTTTEHMKLIPCLNFWDEVASGSIMRFLVPVSFIEFLELHACWCLKWFWNIARFCYFWISCFIPTITNMCENFMQYEVFRTTRISSKNYFVYLVYVDML